MHDEDRNTDWYMIRKRNRFEAMLPEISVLGGWADEHDISEEAYADLLELLYGVCVKESYLRGVMEFRKSDDSGGGV